MVPQPGIFTPLAPCHLHVEYSIKQITEFSGLKRIVRAEQDSSLFRTRRELFGFSDRLWNALSDEKVPRDYRPFRTMQSDFGTVPSTQGDLWVWFQGNSHAWNLDAALNLHLKLTSHGAFKKSEVLGFTRHENRDFTGFIDGTENPVDEAAESAVYIPTEEGSCYAFTQNWVHNLKAFHELSVDEQEQVIGRTKSDSVELQGAEMRPDSHVSRTDAEHRGIKQKIVRRSVPHGNIDAKGLHFVAFACNLDRIQIQLDRMFAISDDGLHDRLVEYSTPVSGSFWFVPSSDSLKKLA